MPRKSLAQPRRPAAAPASSSALSRADVAQLRLVGQSISPPHALTPEAVVVHLGAVQAQDYPGALWSIALRTPDATRADVERAITNRTIIRTWPMRGTLHFVAAMDARWMLELMTPRVLQNAKGRHRQLELDDATFRRSRTIVEKALTREPVLTRTALYALLQARGVNPEGQRGLHILQRFCMEGMLCQGPHLEKQPTFVLLDEWIPASRRLDRDEALRTIAERFFVGHGPATLRDFVWWTGLGVGDAKRAVQMAEPSLDRVSSTDSELWMARHHPVASGTGQRAHLLPGFEEFLLGYKDRSAVLAPRYADRVAPGGNGMFLPTLVLDGQIIGTWRRSARAKSVALEATPFGRWTAADRREFDAPTARYAGFLGTPVTITW